MTSNIHEGLLAALSSHRIVYVRGPNFSARSDALQHISRLPVRAMHAGHDSYGHRLPDSLPADAKARFAYVGAEVYQSLTGLAATVALEVDLSTCGDPHAVAPFCAALGLDALLTRNPFELSGGQQALLAVAAAALLRPRVLSLDCCLEQVDEHRRATLLSLVAGLSDQTAIVVADNEFRSLPMLNGTANLTVSRARHADGLLPMTGAPSHCLPPRLAAPVLGLDGVRFSYASSPPVLRNVNVELHPGVIYWLRGANGAGKSTLSKLLAGVLEPQDGAILADQEPARLTLSPGSLVSYHFQNPDLQLFSTTVWDEVIAGPVAVGCSRTEAVERARQALLQLAIPEGLHATHPLDLPFALRKRVAIAATIASGSPWLILDEPSLGQDDDNTRAMASLIACLAESGVGVILISHSARLSSHLHSSGLMLEDGQIVALDQ